MIKKYLSLIKFAHTIFAMPFAFIGFFLAVSEISKSTNTSFSETFINSLMLKKFLLVIVCMITARSAAMAFNRYLDRSFDAKNPRTAIREIPSGILKANHVLWFTIFSSAAFVASTYFINILCFYLSPIALLVVLGYSFTKRFTPLCHLVLGTGLSLAPIGAYIAVTGSFALLPVMLSFSVLFWVSGFDIIYALQDEDFDKNNRLYSIPSWLGKSKALNVSSVLHVLCAMFIILIGLKGSMNYLYWIGSGIFISMLIYQHKLVKPTDLSRVNLAFMTANGIASVVFAIFVITDLILF